MNSYFAKYSSNISVFSFNPENHHLLDESCEEGCDFDAKKGAILSFRYLSYFIQTLMHNEIIIFFGLMGKLTLGNITVLSGIGFLYTGGP